MVLINKLIRIHMRYILWEFLAHLGLHRGSSLGPKEVFGSSEDFDINQLAKGPGEA